MSPFSLYLIFVIGQDGLLLKQWDKKRDETRTCDTMAMHGKMHGKNSPLIQEVVRPNTTQGLSGNPDTVRVLLCPSAA